MCVWSQGSELNGNKLAVRYPDRIPRGMGISKSALKSVDMQDENVGWVFVRDILDIEI